MKQMVCSVCSFTYDEAQGLPAAGIAPGTPWETLPADFKCPWCGAGKDAFRLKDLPETPETAGLEKPPVETELSAMEMSIICSNLARGCEKQYKPEQMAAFEQLAAFFRSKAPAETDAGIDRLLQLVEQDLAVGYPYGNAAAGQKPDRGALRCQVWSEKVTRMLQSLLKRYQQEGDAMLQNNGVYVCSICGFVSLGQEPPQMCPVCKVPAWKFDKMEGRV